MILSSQSIRHQCIHYKLITPFTERGVSANGLSFGLSSCGYDIRLDDELTIVAGEFKLASTLERFRLPNDLAMVVRDKSTWARRGIFVQNTQAEPGWEGYLTLEITNQSKQDWYIASQEPIAQVVFELLDIATDQPYRGKYQNQLRGAQPARMEEDENRRMKDTVDAILKCRKTCRSLWCVTHRSCSLIAGFYDKAIA